MPFTIVLVGAGNVARTVLAKAVLDRELHRRWPGSADDVLVLTAGVDALDGMPSGPHLETVAAGHGLPVDDHQATSLTRALADSADLLLTMTRKQRAQIVLQHPQARARTFSLVEFAALLHDAAADGPRTSIMPGEHLEARLRRIVPIAAARSLVVGAPTDEGKWDLVDPYACGLDVYESMACAVEDVVRTLVGDVAQVTGRRAARSA